MNNWRAHLDWATATLLSPRQVAALKPTGREAAERICAGVRSDAQVVVEYGPGTGPITDVLCEKLGKNAKLVLFEINRRFAQGLEKRLRQDPRVHVCTGSAANARQILQEYNVPSADHVISGIPFSMMPVATGRTIIQETASILLPGGTFIAYQVKDNIRSLLTEQFFSVEEEIVRELPQDYLLFTAQKCRTLTPART